MPTFEVELSWRSSGTYEIEAPDEDEAVMGAIKEARRDGAETDEFELEGIAEVDSV